MSPSCQQICKLKNETYKAFMDRVSWSLCHYPLVWAVNDHFCGDDDQRIEHPSHQHLRVRRPLLWKLAFQGEIQSSTFVQHFLSASSWLNHFDCIYVKVFEPWQSQFLEIRKKRPSEALKQSFPDADMRYNSIFSPVRQGLSFLSIFQ